MTFNTIYVLDKFLTHFVNISSESIKRCMFSYSLFVVVASEELTLTSIY